MPKATPLQTPSRLDPTLIVLRRVDAARLSVRQNPNADTTMELIGKGYAKQGLEEKELAWFRDGLILNDQPRTSGVTDEIMGATLGFAVARTDTGEVLREFGPDGLGAAEAAIAGAKVTLQVANVSIEEEDDMPEDFDPENPEASFSSDDEAGEADEAGEENTPE